MKENIKKNLKESLLAILPISAIVAVLCFSIAPVTIEVLVMFVVGAAMLVLGMALFTLGAETSMSVIGERIGSYISGRKKLIISAILIVLIGIIIVIAEPDLRVFAEQIHGIPIDLVIGTVAIRKWNFAYGSFFKI